MITGTFDVFAKDSENSAPRRVGSFDSTPYPMDGTRAAFAGQARLGVEARFVGASHGGGPITWQEFQTGPSEDPYP